MDEQRENMQNGMIENETTGEQKPDGGKERRRRGMGAGILLGICGTLVVGALGIYLTCRFTGSQILITNAAADTDTTPLLDAKTTAKINELSAYIDLYYYEDTDIQDLKDGLYAGLLEGLDDRYSVYYTADEYAQTQVSMTGQYYGIGAGLAQDKDTMQVTITRVYEGTPSESAGLRNEDVILSVDGTEADTMDVTDLVKLIRGEAGTTVHLEIYRPSTGENLSFDVERADVTLPSVSSQMLNDTIGYIRIESFEKDTANQFEKALAELEGEGLASLVVDLRYNGGGLVDSVVQILDDILPEGLIVYTEDKNGHREEYRSSGDTHFDYPMAVLINQDSASASEIFAGAIQDNDRGNIVGRRSFGKGLVQEQRLLPDNSALRLTVARYYVPSGRSIQKPYDEGKEKYYTDIYQRLLHGEFSQKDSIHFDEKLKYQTVGGRTVYGGGGIMPDLFVPGDTVGFSRYLVEVNRKNQYLYDFTFDFMDRHRQETKNIKDYKQLLKYLDRFDLVNEMADYAAAKGLKRDEKGIRDSYDVLNSLIKAFK